MEKRKLQKKKEQKYKVASLQKKRVGFFNSRQGKFGKTTHNLTLIVDKRTKKRCIGGQLLSQEIYLLIYL